VHRDKGVLVVADCRLGSSLSERTTSSSIGVVMVSTRRVVVVPGGSLHDGTCRAQRPIIALSGFDA
jgi:hypothetical protein